MPIVRLGNSAALDRGQPIPGNQITTITILDDEDVVTRLRTIIHEDGLWSRSSRAPAAWVECDDRELESALAQYFECPIGEPADWPNV